MPFANQPADTPIPPKLDRWNWGAFFLNWIWGLGNSTFIALLMFVPFVNVIMIFVLGAKGSQWAWKNRLWADEAHFIRTQRNWARAGLAVFLGVFLLLGGCFFSISSALKNNESVALALDQIRGDPRLTRLLGEPIEVNGFVSGNVSFNGQSGAAALSIPISGSKCDARVQTRALKTAGKWEFSLLVVSSICGDQTIVLVNKDNLPIANSEPLEQDI